MRTRLATKTAASSRDVREAVPVDMPPISQQWGVEKYTIRRIQSGVQ